MCRSCIASGIPVYNRQNYTHHSIYRTPQQASILYLQQNTSKQQQFKMFKFAAIVASGLAFSANAELNRKQNLAQIEALQAEIDNAYSYVDEKTIELNGYINAEDQRSPNLMNAGDDRQMMEMKELLRKPVKKSKKARRRPAKKSKKVRRRRRV